MCWVGLGWFVGGVGGLEEVGGWSVCLWGLGFGVEIRDCCEHARDARIFTCCLLIFGSLDVTICLLLEQVRLDFLAYDSEEFIGCF